METELILTSTKPDVVLSRFFPAIQFRLWFFKLEMNSLLLSALPQAIAGPPFTLYTLISLLPICYPQRVCVRRFSLNGNVEGFVSRMGIIRISVNQSKHRPAFCVYHPLLPLSKETSKDTSKVEGEEKRGDGVVSIYLPLISF